MPKKWIQLIRGALFAGGSVTLGLWGESMLGKDVSPYLFVLLAILFFAIGITLDKIWEWIKNHPRFAATVGVASIVVWLGWPWPRIRNWTGRSDLITQKWMTESQTEEYIVNYLKQKREGDVFLTRVRNAMAECLGGSTQARFRKRPGEDWLLFTNQMSDSLIRALGYDGSAPFSQEAGFEIQYLSEDVRTMDWKVVDGYLGSSNPNPQR